MTDNYQFMKASNLPKFLQELTEKSKLLFIIFHWFVDKTWVTLLDSLKSAESS